MAALAVTVNLPEPLYQRLARRASYMHRTVEAEIVEAVNTSLPEEPALDAEKVAEIEALHLKRQRDGLSVTETQSLATLMQEYTRIMLVRARSAALLKQRGHDVAELLEDE